MIDVKERKRLIAKKWREGHRELARQRSREWMKKARANGYIYIPRDKITKKEGHCKRCDILFTHGGIGDGEWCDDCLNEMGIL